jgi:DNA-binding PadR family transcriptional regulator
MPRYISSKILHAEHVFILALLYELPRTIPEMVRHAEATGFLEFLESPYTLTNGLHYLRQHFLILEEWQERSRGRAKVYKLTKKGLVALTNSVNAYKIILAKIDSILAEEKEFEDGVEAMGSPGPGGEAKTKEIRS